MGILRSCCNFVSFGAVDRLDAKKITKASKAREEDAKAELEVQKKLTQKDLVKLGEIKTKVYSNTITEFVEAYRVIEKIDLSPLKHSKENISYKQIKSDMRSLQSTSSTMKDIVVTGGSGALGGAVAACGAWGIAGLVGTASTGTAIGSLSGVAATNATLAWLGGGAVSAGGSGVAGGMLVLGGVALAPVAIAGMFFGVKKGEQKLNHAKEYEVAVDALVEKILTLTVELSQIRRGASILGESILKMNDVVKIQTSKMTVIIHRLAERSIFDKKIKDPIKRLFDMSILSDSEAEIIKDAANSASFLRQLLEKPLMNEEGAFLSEVIDFLEKKKSLVDNMQIKIAA